MKINVAITNNNLKSEICKFFSTVNKFNIFFKKIEEINDKTNELTLIIADKNNHEKHIQNLKKLLVHEYSNLCFFISIFIKIKIKC